MIYAQYDISKIEQALYDVVKASGMTLNIFPADRPDTVVTSMNDFAVVKVVTAVTDLNAYGKGICRIEMFARDLPSGIKNQAKITYMTGKLISALPIQHSTYLFDSGNSIVPMGRDGKGFSVVGVNINLIIKNL